MEGNKAERPLGVQQSEYSCKNACITVQAILLQHIVYCNTCNLVLACADMLIVIVTLDTFKRLFFLGRKAVRRRVFSIVLHCPPCGLKNGIVIPWYRGITLL